MGGGQGRGGTYLDQSGRRLLDAHIFFGGGAGRSGSLVIRRQGGWAGRRGRRRGRQDWRAARHVHGRLGGCRGWGWGWVSGWACEEGRRPTGGSISTLIPLGPVRGRGKRRMSRGSGAPPPTMYCGHTVARALCMPWQGVWGGGAGHGPRGPLGHPTVPIPPYC